jgi:uracil-DNA glycosylase family 4
MPTPRARAARRVRHDGRVTKARRLEKIAEEIRAHRGCGFEPCETCTNPVPGEGAPDAAIVVVGEAPGAAEDAAGRPFVGRAGKLLDGLLEEAGLVRADVFITNVLKARPPKNRDPRTDEVEHSWPWLRAQLDVIEPELLVPLGRHALRRFAPDLKIAEVHGTAVEAGGVRLFPLYHPAAAIYNQSLRETLRADARRLGETVRAA